eukprot:4705132-Prymnesium_polylepis.1
MCIRDRSNHRPPLRVQPHSQFHNARAMAGGHGRSWQADQALDKCLDTCADQLGFEEGDSVLVDQLAEDLKFAENVELDMQRYLSAMQRAITVSPSDAITHRLPLARIKRIMKQDACTNPRMIGGDAVPAMALACQLLVGALTTRAWAFAAAQNRHTLQLKDLISAIDTSDRFDFLVDVVADFTNGDKLRRDDTETGTHA